MKIYLILFLFAFLLTLETQAKNHNKTITKKEFLDSQMKILEARFNAVDTNKDGKITSKYENPRYMYLCAFICIDIIYKCVCVCVYIYIYI